ncbi:MAG: hypothetical protein HRU03_02690 [Nanoarchaeales archaeon]|nr:hypothetical protein [Nanoarchaeales archaeon]
MVNKTNLAKIIPVVATSMFLNPALAQDCNITSSLELANSFTNKVGIITSDEPITQPKVIVKCGSNIFYGTQVNKIENGKDFTLFGAKKNFKINEDLKVNFGIEKLHTYGNNKTSNIVYGGVSYNGPVNIEVSHNKFIDSDKSFIKFDFSKSFQINNDLKIKGNIGYVDIKGFNEKLDNKNRIYGGLGLEYELNKNTKLFANFEKQITPFENTKFGVRISHTF